MQHIPEVEYAYYLSIKKDLITSTILSICVLENPVIVVLARWVYFSFLHYSTCQDRTLSNELDSTFWMIKLSLHLAGQCSCNNFPPTLSPYPTNWTLVILWETCCLHLQHVGASLWCYSTGYSLKSPFHHLLFASPNIAGSYFYIQSFHVVR